MKKVLLILTVGILVLGTMAMSFADGIFNPAQVYGDLVGISEEEAYNLHIAIVPSTRIPTVKINNTFFISYTPYL